MTMRSGAILDDGNSAPNLYAVAATCSRPPQPRPYMGVKVGLQRRPVRASLRLGRGPDARRCAAGPSRRRSKRSELVVEAGAEQTDVLRRALRPDRRAEVGGARQRQVKVFDLRSDVVGERIFDAGADRAAADPAVLRAAKAIEYGEGRIRSHAGITAGDEEQSAIQRDAGACASGEDLVDVHVIGDQQVRLGV